MRIFTHQPKSGSQMTMKAILKLLARDSRGATAIEYGLIVALIAVAAIGGMKEMAGGSGSMWGDIQTQVSAATQGV